MERGKVCTLILTRNPETFFYNKATNNTLFYFVDSKKTEMLFFHKVCNFPYPSFLKFILYEKKLLY